MENQDNWLALAIGNSRLHWAWFQRNILIEAWDTAHLSDAVEPNRLPQDILPANLIAGQLTQIPVYIASVVCEQTKLWHNYSQLYLISLKDLELQNIYPSLGIDRALAAWGAVKTYNQACLVIDGGTALTFTGVDRYQTLVGGAILPGLRSQLMTLKQKTSALPTVQLPQKLPRRWALSTDEAIASGITYTALAGIHSYIADWQLQFPDSQVIFTGGDGELLARYFYLQFPTIARQPIIKANLILEGINLVHHNRLLS